MMVLMADQALLDQKALRYVETSVHASCCCQEPHSQTRSGGRECAFLVSFPGRGWRSGIEARGHTLELGQYYV